MTGQTNDLGSILERLNEIRKQKAAEQPVSESGTENVPGSEHQASLAEQKNLFVRRAQVLKEIVKIDKRLKDATFENYTITPKGRSKGQERVVAICKRFADRFVQRLVSGKNIEIGLLMVGNFGTGKSHLASAILNQLEQERVPGIYIEAVDFFDYVNSKYLPLPLPEFIGKLSLVACLVIDELGVQSWSKAEQKRLQQIIDSRAKNKLPTILCTNLSQTELAQCCGGRVVSRVAELTYPLTFEWDDFRVKQSPGNQPAEDVF